MNQGKEQHVRIRQKVKKQRNFSSKKVYKSHKLELTIPSRYKDIVEPFLNKDLKVETKRVGDSLVIEAKPAKNTRSSSFYNRMLRMAKIHNNPRLVKIHLHTFRHCKALREYHKTRDVLHVMAILGHRQIETTYRYVRLYNQVYKNENPDQFVTKIASTKEERFELFNNGWTKVGEDRNDWYFTKPK
ncbi:tyrosine-type recombinase/integrase [Candidatus Bathyarchaeota archaeon]|nr:tyrosine-type recombinase/integrase [Candidatus Bathyarchaeota archaeon]